MLWSVCIQLRGREDISLRDRKSTRLNSSHSQISYAVFCLKKKKQRKNTQRLNAAREDLQREPQHSDGDERLGHTTTRVTGDRLMDARARAPGAPSTELAA